VMSNGALRPRNDHPIAAAGPGNMGHMRGWGPDSTWYMASATGGDRTVLLGQNFGLAGGWEAWFINTFRVERDARDLDTFNRFGSPYSGGGLFVMADGSVRTINFTTTPRIVANLITPIGGETINE